MTQVTRKHLSVCAGLLAFATTATSAHSQPDPWSASHVRGQESPANNAAKPAETLYLKLRSVGLDPEKTFHIRGASIDRSALHVTLEDGEISFTSSVDGHITGAFFSGDGEVLLTPPNQVERASMTLFTGMAILEERFLTGYLRFNDQTFADLQPYLRPADDPKEFSSRWNETARNLAEPDALRLLATFSRTLPVVGDFVGPGAQSTQLDDRAADRMLHGRLQGEKVGAFDVYFDSTASEQIWAGQAKTEASTPFYNLWTSFSLPNATKEPDGASTVRPDDVDVSAYKIRAEVKPPTRLDVEANVEMSVLRGGARTVFFELSRFLQVKEVETDERALEFINNPAIDGTQLAKRGNDLVAVIFPQPLRPGQKLALRFVYGGDVLSEAGGGLLYVGARGIWYPNRGMRRSEFDLEFHYPSGWTLVATGKRVTDGIANDAQAVEGSEVQSSGELVGRWVTERPSSLAGFNLGRYQHATAKAGDVTVSAYAARGVERNFPRGSEPVVAIPSIRESRPAPEPLRRESAAPSPARNAQAVADEAARAVDFFAKRFGPFPYSSLKLTQMPGQLSQGWPGLVFLSSFSFLTRAEEEALRQDPTQAIFNHLVLPHETAHQWWGDLVGWRTYRDQWIVEALANYCALMMVQERNPLEFRKALDQYRVDLLEKSKQGELLRDAGPVTLGQRLNSSHFPNGYEAISYGRGTWLFHMLRYMLLDAEGTDKRRPRAKPDVEEPFMRALRKVRERYAGKDISTQELFAVFEEDLPRPLWYEGHKSLDWFVQGWVEGVTLPHISLQNVKYVQKEESVAVNGTILQKNAPDDLVTAVPVYTTVNGKPALLGTVFADGPESPFHLSAPSGTKKIVLDPNQTLLTSPK